MTWNLRVVKEKIEASDYFSVREVFYNDDGSIRRYTEEATGVAGESVEELRQYALWVLECLDKPVLVDGEVTFVDKYGE
jgi:hypothetical protein